MLRALRVPDVPQMVEYLSWLLVAMGLGLLFGGQWLRRRAAARREAAEQAEQAEQAETRQRVEQQAAAERLATERAAEAQRLADEQVERERRAAAAAELEAQRATAERAELEAAAKAEARRLAEQQRDAAERAEATRVEAERIESARVEAERAAARLAAEAQAERERLAAIQAERDAQRRAAEHAARAAEARAEAQRQAEWHAEQERLEAERQAAATPPRVVKTAAQTLVMVADDSKVVRIKTGRLLAQHQYQVSYANDGLDAVQQMQTAMPDVLITDVEMPGMDGFELTRHLRGNPQTAQLPVIMITAADDRHREHAEQAGVSVLLGKPYPEDALIAHIRQAMGQDAELPPAAARSTLGALDALA